MNNHFHHLINVVIKEGFNSGFGGQAWVSLKMTNDSLTAGIYTVVFEIFSFAVYFLTDETLITQVNGDSNFNVITFSHDYNGQYSKAFIQFSSNGQPGEITFQIRCYGSKYNNNRLVFKFYSRVIAGKQNTHFNHNLLSVKSTDYSGTILYFDLIQLTPKVQLPKSMLTIKTLNKTLLLMIYLLEKQTKLMLMMRLLRLI